MKSKYEKNQRVLIYIQKELREYVVFSESSVKDMYWLYPVDDTDEHCIVRVENDIYGAKELRIFFNELENLVLSEKSTIFENILHDAGIYSKLFKVENFLCENDPKMKR